MSEKKRMSIQESVAKKPVEKPRNTKGVKNITKKEADSIFDEFLTGDESGARVFIESKGYTYNSTTFKHIK